MVDDEIDFSSHAFLRSLKLALFLLLEEVGMGPGRTTRSLNIVAFPLPPPSSFDACLWLIADRLLPSMLPDPPYNISPVVGERGFRAMCLDISMAVRVSRRLIDSAIILGSLSTWFVVFCVLLWCERVVRRRRRNEALRFAEGMYDRFYFT